MSSRAWLDSTEAAIEQARIYRKRPPPGIIQATPASRRHDPPPDPAAVPGPAGNRAGPVRCRRHRAAGGRPGPVAAAGADALPQ
ncbi:hypothetical protein G6F50_017593 [Rhizopus delemar]|uniref:Uncharacterized protein n=1 Tax=Rhizopus delemar TaxID=936053 RepID=A0A9P6XPJ4_9FUNG|nr:hypothetical protein G6F50_017593 [Rhizopus delemar]